MKTKVVRFKCPMCNENIPIFAAGNTGDGRIMLVGECKCGEHVLIDIDKVISSLYSSDIPDGN